jgi:hypothetical protein
VVARPSPERHWRTLVVSVGGLRTAPPKCSLPSRTRLTASLGLVSGDVLVGSVVVAGVCHSLFYQRFEQRLVSESCGLVPSRSLRRRCRCRQREAHVAVDRWVEVATYVS